MENLELNTYRNRRVLITGHTGFKGSWLTAWLQILGSMVVGYSLAPREEDHFSLLNLSDIDHHLGDVRDLDNLTKVIKQTRPEIVFHLAAQSLVRPSFADPVDTMSTNVMGTVNLLEACGRCDSVAAVVVVTTDKCYDERDGGPYNEQDPLGGDSPYSASKACAELISQSYRRSFCQSGPLIASARAGNVIGGGDMCVDRLIPDLVRGVFANKVIRIRYPQAIRPWQHVLDCLMGYLQLGARLLDGQAGFARAWNFGPATDQDLTVAQVIEIMQRHWPAVRYQIEHRDEDPPEAPVLRLNSQAALQQLVWRPVMNATAAIQATVEWYRAFHEHGKLITTQQIQAYR